MNEPSPFDSAPDESWAPRFGMLCPRHSAGCSSIGCWPGCAQQRTRSWDEELAGWFWQGLVAASLVAVLAGWGLKAFGAADEVETTASASVASQLLEGSTPGANVLLASMSSAERRDSVARAGNDPARARVRARARWWVARAWPWRLAAGKAPWVCAGAAAARVVAAATAPAWIAGCNSASTRAHGIASRPSRARGTAVMDSLQRNSSAPQWIRSSSTFVRRSKLAASRPVPNPRAAYAAAASAVRFDEPRRR